MYLYNLIHTQSVWECFACAAKIMIHFVHFECLATESDGMAARSGYYFLIVWFIFIQTAVRNKAAPFYVRFHSSQAGSGGSSSST